MTKTKHPNFITGMLLGYFLLRLLSAHGTQSNIFFATPKYKRLMVQK